MLWKLAYNTFAVPAMFVGFHCAQCCNPKIREGIKGRKRVFAELANRLQTARHLEKTAWFHFTSVGEFEQAKPLIEAIYAETRIVLTFFSPSVAPNAQSYPYADAAVYLPLDTPRNAERLIQLIEPSLIVFSKFDIWPNLVWKASKHGIPIIVVAGTLHAESKRLSRFTKPFFRSVHRYIRVHCAISEADAARFQELCSPAHEIVVTGDTRYEQVYRRAVSVEPDTEFFPGQATLKRPILIAGSTYTEDEKVLLPAYQLLRQNMPGAYPHLILVPHEPRPERIKEIRGHLDEAELAYLCFSELTPEVDLSEVNVLIVDSVGLLAKLYRLADIAFVGGSFRGSVHNVMEPAAMAKPVIFGPTIQNAHEASLLVDRGGAKLVRTAQELADTITVWLDNADARTAAGSIGKQLIEENLGAVERTLVHLQKHV
jgi:3-deoxy-D-manno-octulosonic-acid transferase